MLPTTLPTDPAAAYALGVKAGEDPIRIAGDCPYDHESLALRIRWMDGFSAARGALGTSASPRAEPQSAR